MDKKLFDDLVQGLKEAKAMARCACSAGPKDPDQPADLKQTHEAAGYDAWFRAQIEASIDDARPSIPDHEARVAFAKRKALQAWPGQGH